MLELNLVAKGWQPVWPLCLRGVLHSSQLTFKRAMIAAACTTAAINPDKCPSILYASFFFSETLSFIFNFLKEHTSFGPFDLMSKKIQKNKKKLFFCFLPSCSAPDTRV
jgi:hypothetical protein